MDRPWQDRIRRTQRRFGRVFRTQRRERLQGAARELSFFLQALDAVVQARWERRDQATQRGWFGDFSTDQESEERYLRHRLHWLLNYVDSPSQLEELRGAITRRARGWTVGLEQMLPLVDERFTQLLDSHDAKRRTRLGGLLLLLGVAVLLTVSVLSVADLLDSWTQHGHLVPGDAPAVVGAIVGIGGALGTLIGASLTAFAKLIQARGQADAEKIRARAELIRAEAEMHRARTGQLPGPAIAPDPSGTTPATAPPA